MIYQRWVFCMLFLLGVHAVLGASESNDVTADVSVRSSSKEYLLGQLVTLSVRIKNTGEKSFKVYDLMVDEDGVEPEIEVHVSRDGVKYDRHVILGNALFINRHIDILTIEPGKYIEYRLQVVATANHKDQGRLAFDRPGKYHIKVKYPLVIPKPLKRRLIWSEASTIEIKEPKESEAKIWKVIQQPEYLSFLQCGWIYRPQNEHVAINVAELMLNHPDSSYQRTMTRALTKYYKRRRAPLNDKEVNANADLRMIKKALGVVERPPLARFQDRRLDQVLGYHFPKQTPLAKVFKEFSEQSGVLLSHDSAFERNRFQSGANTKSLREIMNMFEHGEREWVEDRKGYRLVPAPLREPVPDEPR